MQHPETFSQQNHGYLNFWRVVQCFTNFSKSPKSVTASTFYFTNITFLIWMGWIFRCPDRMLNHTSVCHISFWTNRRREKNLLPPPNESVVPHILLYHFQRILFSSGWGKVKFQRPKLIDITLGEHLVGEIHKCLGVLDKWNSCYLVILNVQNL